MAATDLDLPLDVRLMAVATRALVALFAALAVGVIGLWAVRHPAWSVQSVLVQGDVVHQNAVSIRSQLAAPLRNALASGFLALDLRQVQRLFESVPWVRKAVVQREFPNRLRVTIEEHQPVAWWGGAGGGHLVNHLGEVFEATPDELEGLPELSGPEHQSAQVWALFQPLKAEFARHQLVLLKLQLNERGGWRAELEGGAVVELGRGTPEALQARVARFMASLGQIQQRYPGPLQYADLRYPNGYALRVRGVTTLVEAPNTPPKTR